MAAANEILPGLWLGNRGAALSQEFLKDHKIHAVFNFSKEIPFAERSVGPHGSSLPERLAETIPTGKYRIPVDDNLQPEEIRNLELWASEFVPRIIGEWRKGPVLLHCHAGMQRSAAAAAMSLMYLTHANPETAMAYVKHKRPIAFTPTANFRDAIRGYYRYLEGEWAAAARAQ
jgi:protein tyrosine/serine phosphatase